MSQQSTLTREDALARGKQLVTEIRAILDAKKRRDLAWDESQHPRDDAGKFTEGSSSVSAERKSKRDPEDRLRELSPRTPWIESGEHTMAAATVTADVMEEMKAKGYTMPDDIEIKRNSMFGIDDTLNAIVETDRDSHATITKLTIYVPRSLPEGASLDEASQVAFGGTEPAVNDPDRKTYDRFSGTSMRDLIVHEMAHVQHGHDNIKMNKRVSSQDLVDGGHFESAEEVERAMRRVSQYAATDYAEFVAEAFTRMYRGEKIPEDSYRLYHALRGPEVKR